MVQSKEEKLDASSFETEEVKKQLAEVQSLWQVPAIAQYIWLFNGPMKMTRMFSMIDFERGLINSSDSHVLNAIVPRLLEWTGTSLAKKFENGETKPYFFWGPRLERFVHGWYLQRANHRAWCLLADSEVHVSAPLEPLEKGPAASNTPEEPLEKGPEPLEKGAAASNTPEDIVENTDNPNDPNMGNNDAKLQYLRQERWGFPPKDFNVVEAEAQIAILDALLAPLGNHPPIGQSLSYIEQIDACPMSGTFDIKKNIEKNIEKDQDPTKKTKDFNKISPTEKVHILAALCDYHLFVNPATIDIINEYENNDLRVEPFAVDRNGFRYFWFQSFWKEFRVYRQTVQRKCEDKTEAEYECETNGCPFEGTLDEVNQHEKQCNFVASEDDDSDGELCEHRNFIEETSKRISSWKNFAEPKWTLVASGIANIRELLSQFTKKAVKPLRKTKKNKKTQKNKKNKKATKAELKKAKAELKKAKEERESRKKNKEFWDLEQPIRDHLETMMYIFFTFFSYEILYLTIFQKCF